MSQPTEESCERVRWKTSTTASRLPPAASRTTTRRLTAGRISYQTEPFSTSQEEGSPSSSVDSRVVPLGLAGS